MSPLGVSNPEGCAQREVSKDGGDAFLDTMVTEHVGDHV